MDLSGGGIRARYEKALERCADQIDWYERHAGRARFLYRLFQTAAVVLAGLTPVLSLWHFRGPVEALTAALASNEVAGWDAGQASRGNVEGEPE